MMKARLVALAGVGLGLVLAAEAIAQVDPADIEWRLSVMERYAREKKLRELPAARLGASALAELGLTARKLRVGETWAVRFTPHGDPGLAGMAATARAGGGAAPVAREASIYDFRVIALDDSGLARVKVSQRVAHGGPRAEERVDHLVLVMDKAFALAGKEIHYRDGRAPLILTVDAQKSAVMGFDAAPIDLPNLGSDPGERAVDPATGAAALAFHLQDSYARTVDVLWRQGEVWPARVETTAGVAELIK